MGFHRCRSKPEIQPVKRTTLLACVSLLAGCTPAAKVSDGSIEPFTSDKCSYYAEGTYTQRNLWCHCCVEHDQYYWMGGTKQQRRNADTLFKQCILQTGATANSNLMWLGVRIAGGPATNASYRWGFGWPHRRPYTTLSNDEQRRLEQQISKLPEDIGKYCTD